MLAASGHPVCGASRFRRRERQASASVASLVYDYTTLEHAEQTFTGGPLHGTVTVVESSGGPFAEGQSSATTCFVYSRRSEAGLDLETPCTNTDASGERWFVMAVRKGGGHPGRRWRGKAARSSWAAPGSTPA